MKVYKVGGSCLRDGTSLDPLLNILERNGRKILVFSAFSGITDALYRIAELQRNERASEFMDLVNWHVSIISKCGEDAGDRYMDVLSKNAGCRNADELISSIRDFSIEKLVSLGELMSAATFYIYAIRRGFPAAFIPSHILGVRVQVNENERKIIPHISSELIRNSLDSVYPEFIITTGFFGLDQEGNFAVLGRNSSDYSAAAIACLSGAREVIFLKDVEGIYSGDPKMSSFFTLMRQVSYQDALKISKAGSRILHPSAIEICMNYSMPMKIMKVGGVEHGTLIHGESD